MELTNKQMIKINTVNDLYKLILKENYNVTQVNKILQSCLPQTAFFICIEHTSSEIVELLKIYFKEYKDSREKPIFIDFSFDEILEN